MKDEDYICIVAEIFDGYTETVFNENVIFIKHFSLADQRFIENFQKKYFSKAVDRGIPTEESVLKLLYEEGLWSDEEDRSIKIKKDEIDNLKITKKKLPLISQKESIQKRIDEVSFKILKLETKKKELLGSTAEHYAENRANEEFLRGFIFTDKNLTKLLYSQEDFDNLEMVDLLKIQQLRQSINDRFDDDVIQRTILKPFFSLYMSMCEDALSFYGRPAVELSIPQLKLLAYGRMFQNIFSYTENIPDNIREDPKKLISFSEAQRDKGSGQKLVKEDASGSAIFGASKEDIKHIADSDGGGGVKLTDALKEKGGKLSMEDMMKLSGDD